MNFADPKQLFWSWLIIVGAILLFNSIRRRQGRMRLYGGENFSRMLTRPVKKSRLYTKGALLLLALSYMVISLARPRWGFEWREVKHKGSDLMIALDLSYSMMAQDVNPNRLEQAKRKIMDILDQAKGDRIGLVAFAGEAVPYIPLTVDRGMFKMFLNDLNADLITAQGSSLAKALEISIKSLSEASASGPGGKAILILSDGEDHGSEPLKFAKEAKEKGVKIFAMGFGTPEGAPVPAQGGGFKKDGSGQVAMSKLDEKALKEIVEAADGLYVRSGPTDQDLKYIYQDGIKGHLTEEQLTSSREQLMYERYQWFLGAALLLLIFEFLLPLGGKK